VLDLARWIAIIWLLIAMGWLAQLAVISRSISVTLLAIGLGLSLFVDIGDQYERLGAHAMSYRLPTIYVELILITLGMFFYVRGNPSVNLIPPFYFFFRYKAKKRMRRRTQ
jgi:hypothetical protein